MRRRPWSDVFVCLADDDALDADAASSLLEALRTALAGHGAGLLWSGLATDGRRLLSRVRAPGPEAVDAALAAAGMRAHHLWAGPCRPLCEDVSANVAVEHCRRGADAGALPDGPAQQCLTTYRIVPLRRAVSADGRHTLVLYRAPDAESVRLALRHAGVRASRVWRFRSLTPAPCAPSAPRE